jgi:hypothetical protein
MEADSPTAFSQINPQLASHSDLFYRALSRFRSRYRVLILTNLFASTVPFIVGLISGLGAFLLVSATGVNSIPAIILIAISVLAAVILMVIAGTWGQVAFLTAIVSPQNLKVSTALSQSRSLIGRYLWLSSLVSIFTVVGFFFLIIPGVIFIVWFCFSFYILATENISPFDSLLMSREYARKRNLAILGRLLFLLPFIIGPLLISALLDYLLSTQIFTPLANFILSFIITPFTAAYIYELFLSLKEAKGKFVFDPDSQTKTIFTIIPIVGIVILIATPLLIFTLMIDPASQIKKAIAVRNEADFVIIQSALERHKALRLTYPQTLNSLIEEGELQTLPENFEYKLNKKGYELCLTIAKEKTCRQNSDLTK